MDRRTDTQTHTHTHTGDQNSALSPYRGVKVNIINKTDTGAKYVSHDTRDDKPN